MSLNRPQYGMRSLFMLMTLMGCVLGWMAWQQRLARERLETLELARQASRVFDERLRTAVGSGTFRQYEQAPGENQLTLRTEATLSAFYDRGRYHIRADFQKRLRSYRTHEFGAEPRTGNRRIMDDKPEALFIVYDGAEATVVADSPRWLPDGYWRTVHKDVNSAASLQGIAWGDVMRLGGELVDLNRLVENLTLQKMELVDLPAGGIQVRYAMRNPPQVRAEIDISAEHGFHPIACRVYNPGQHQPASETTADWRQLDGVWYVHRLSELRRRPNGTVVKRSFEFDRFTVNPDIQPWLFTGDSIEYQSRSATAFAGHFVESPE